MIRRHIVPEGFDPHSAPSWHEAENLAAASWAGDDDTGRRTSRVRRRTLIASAVTCVAVVAFTALIVAEAGGWPW
jgi:hypothetical protein